MPYIIPKKKTKIKAEITDSANLAKDQWVDVGGSKSIGVIDLDYDRSDHAEIKLAGAIGPFKEGDEVFIYAPHWNIPGELKDTKAELPTEHFDQIDNYTGYHGSGARQCNLTSHAMLICDLFPDFKAESRRQGFKEPEGYYGKLLAPYGDTTDHTAHTRLLYDHFGVDSYWTTTLSPKDVRRSLEAGYAVPAGFIYKSSGHICLIVGDAGEKGWLVNDPYGLRAGPEDFYIQIGNHSGDHDLYSNACMQGVYWEQAPTRDPQTGWGRIITTVNGKSTGLPKGL